MIKQQLHKHYTVLLGLLLLCPFLLFSQTQVGQDIDGEAVSDFSGNSVSLSADGTVMAIGAFYNDGDGINSGHVRIYSYDGTNWNQLGADIDGEAVGDLSGESVSLSADGTRVAIGAPFNDGNGTKSGHVRIYSYDGTNWNQLGVDIDGEAAFDNSGYSVSMSADGSRVAIGAYNNDGNGDSSGHVRVYSYDGTNWNQLGADIDGEVANNFSGVAVSMSADGSRVAIGANRNSANGIGSGHVRIYSYDGTNWNQLGQDIDGEAADDRSGRTLTLSADGTRVAIAAPLNDGNGDNSGHVRIYSYDGTTWNQLGVDIDGEAASDGSGSSVSLNTDGTIAAIGARYNAGNGSISGHVRIYSFDGTNWNQLGVDIDGEAAFDGSGYSVSLNADGTLVAIGAFGNDENGTGSGHVRVYSLIINASPTALCQNSTIQLDAMSTATITAADVDNGSNDAEGAVTLSIDQDTFDCSNIGENTVTLTVTDSEGLTATCTATVTVEDTIAPEITIPDGEDLLVNYPLEIDLADSTGNFANAFLFGGATPPSSGNPLCVNATAGTDGSQRMTTAIISTLDTNNFTFSTDFNISQFTNDLPNNVTGGTNIIMLSNAFRMLGVLMLPNGNFGASHNNGNNLDSGISINEEEWYTTSVVYSEGNLKVFLNDQIVIDETIGELQDSIIVNGNTFNAVLAFSTRNGGNGTTLSGCVRNFSVANLVSEITVDSDEIACSYTVQGTEYDATFSDNCESSTITNDFNMMPSLAGVILPVGETVITWTVNDGNGQTDTAIATITVEDNTAPTITCPADETVLIDEGTQYVVPDYFATGAATATDACTDPITIFSQTPAAGSSLDAGTFTISLTAEDAAGNEDTCDFELIVDTVLGTTEVAVSSLKVFPNPAVGVVTISNPNGLNIQTIEVRDMLGRLVLSKNLNTTNSTNTVDVSKLNNATYMLMIMVDGATTTKQLIKR